MFCCGYCSVTKSCLTLCNWPHGHRTSDFPVHHYLPELAKTHIHWVCDALCFILCHLLLLLPSIFPSIRVFSNESALSIWWTKYWGFSISPFDEYSGFISFRIDWFDLFAVQRSLESSPAPQFESISSLVLSLLYDPTLTFMTTGKIIALTIWTFVSKWCVCFLIFCPGLSQSKLISVNWTFHILGVHAK